MTFVSHDRLNAMNTRVLDIDNIFLSYDKIEALKGVSLYLNAGEIVAIIGANGAGKTSLINTVSGVLKPHQGEIRFKGESITHLPAHLIARKRIVQVPEGRKLFNKLTVTENLEMGAYPESDQAKIRAGIDSMRTLFPILAERRNQPAGTLSGGEQQMLAIARGLIPDAVIDRPKGYFPVPALKYIDGPVLAMVRDALNSRVARERGIFQRPYLDKLLADPAAHITPLRGSKLWQVALLELWLQTRGL